VSESRPPESQEEVVNAVLAELRRRLDAARKAADRSASRPGPVGDAVRAVRDALRGVADRSEREDPGPGRGPRELPPGE